jgi:hypothetical protein
MAAHGIGERVAWSNRGMMKSGKVRAIVAANEGLGRAKERALEENAELDMRRLRIHHENRTSSKERYLVEVSRLSRGLNLDSPDWLVPTTKIVDATTNSAVSTKQADKNFTQPVEWHYHGTTVDGALDSEVWWAPDFGVVIRRGHDFWASNDTRWPLIGVKPNAELVEPTIGPFSSKEEATESYVKALGALP